MSRYKVRVRQFFSKESSHYIRAESEEEAGAITLEQVAFNFENYDKYGSQGLTWEGNDVIIGTEKLKEWDKDGREITNER